MSWLVVGVGAAAAAAGLLIPAWKLWKRRRYDDAVLEYRYTDAIVIPVLL